MPYVKFFPKKCRALMPQHHLLVHKDCCVKHILTLKGVSVFSLCGTWSSVPSVLLLFKLDVTSGTLLKSVFEIKHINKLEGYRTETGKLFALTCQHFQCLKQFHQRERITESIRLEKISETIESNLWPNTTTSTRPGYLSAMSRKYTKLPIIPIPQKTMGEVKARSNYALKLCFPNSSWILETVWSNVHIWSTKINLTLLLTACFWRQNYL